jgi:hypothetical protein
MNITYPLTGVMLRQVEAVREIKDPLYEGTDCQVSSHEFAMQMAEVGSFYACNGNEVEYAVDPDADEEWVRLCLYGKVLVALLHQRRIINFHASSFVHKGRGVMILGETGAGKSSLTASFTLDGALFLSDDLTPVMLRGHKPYIIPLFPDIKLEDNSIGQLKIGTQQLKKAEAGTGKHYLRIGKANIEEHQLHSIIKIEVGETETPSFFDPDPATKFSLLRSEICSWDILAGMPDTEKDYLHQLLQIAQNINIVRLVRPAGIEITVLHDTIRDYLEKRR